MFLINKIQCPKSCLYIELFRLLFWFECGRIPKFHHRINEPMFFASYIILKSLENNYFYNYFQFSLSEIHHSRTIFMIILFCILKISSIFDSIYIQYSGVSWFLYWKSKRKGLSEFFNTRHISSLPFLLTLSLMLQNETLSMNEYESLDFTSCMRKSNEEKKYIPIG